MTETADVVVVGSGIVGLAAARALLVRHPRLSLLVLDKEAGPARHQSGRNSGVVHAGLYYAPGSLKARLCVDGRRRLYAYCAAHGVPHERCGKVVVAVTAGEMGRLDELERRGHANGVEGLERIDGDALRGHEPHVSGVAGLWSPESGVVDYVGVCAALARDVERAGGRLRYGSEVTAIDPGARSVALTTPRGRVDAGFALVCAGLQSDRLARLTGGAPRPRVVPFRGRYLRLRPHARPLCRGLIYPVPDPALPFLGVHLTRRVDGDVWVGPTALPAAAREGYGGGVDGRDVVETLLDPGFRRLARRHWRAGLGELGTAASRRHFVAAARRLVPSLRPADVTAGPSGIRAQLLDADGTLVDDFRLDRAERCLHVRNAPSPAATSCLALAEIIAEEVDAQAA